MGCLKRVPTKALTVAFFELGTQLLMRRQRVEHISSAQHLNIATLSGVMAVMCTFPLHSLYYATRKGVTCAHVFQAYTASRRVMFSGAIPALASTVPAVFVDYSIYKTLRTTIDNNSASTPSTVSIVAAATTANLLGGVLAEPFKAVSRRVAVDSVRNIYCGSVAATTREMLQSGVGEFWRGYQRRIVRYAVSAVVSKTAVRQIRRPKQNEAQVALSRPVMVLPRKRRVGSNMRNTSSMLAYSVLQPCTFR
ncbi:Mitochondrial carrier [Gracilaria domingensis]|nr:Mitochondrial carrier [Gracilaria domingensis]